MKPHASPPLIDPHAAGNAHAPPVAAALAAARRRLTDAGVDTPELDARVMLQAVTGWSRARLLTDPSAAIGADAAAAFDAMVARREAREPVARILGTRGFWTLDLDVAPATLDPRPDSETLVSAALALTPKDVPVRAADLGCGTGCLLLAFLSERPLAAGIGIDVNADAVAVSRRNAERHGLSDRSRFVVGDWSASLDDNSIDLVLANPPYIETEAIAALSPEVRSYDPLAALDGGPDGLDAYRALAADLPRVLAPSGHAVIEIGLGQAEPVSELFSSAEISIIAIHKDLGGIERCLVGRSRIRKKAVESPLICR